MVSPIVAAIISFFLPGIGQIVQGDTLVSGIFHSKVEVRCGAYILIAIDAVIAVGLI